MVDINKIAVGRYVKAANYIGFDAATARWIKVLEIGERDGKPMFIGRVCAKVEDPAGTDYMVWRYFDQVVETR